MKIRLNHKSALIILFYFFLSCLLTYPLIFNLGSFLNVHHSKSHAYGETDDMSLGNLHSDHAIPENTISWSDAPRFVYSLYSTKKSILNHTSMFHLKEVYYPEGISIKRSIFCPTYSIVGALLIFITNCKETVAHNLLCIMSIFLSAVSMYLFSLEISKDRLGSILAGLIYGSSNYLLFQVLAGHVHYMQLQWVPLIFLFFDRLLSKPCFKTAIFMGIFLGLQVLSAAQYAVYLTIFLPMYLILRNIKALVNKKFIACVILCVLVSFIICGWFLYQYSLDQFQLPDRSLQENVQGSAYLKNFLLVESSRSLGIITLIISLAAIWLLIEKKRKFFSFLFLALISVFLSLGVSYSWAPYTFLYKYWPLINKFRVPSRIYPFISMYLSIIIALGFSSLYHRSSHFYRLYRIGMFIVLMLVVYFGQINLSSYASSHCCISLLNTKKSPIYESIRKQPGEFTIIEYPQLRSDFNPVYAYNVIRHQKNIIGGSEVYIPEQYYYFMDIGGRSLDFSSGAFRQLLRDWNLRYMIFHSEKYDNWDQFNRYLNSKRELKFIQESGEAYLYEVLLQD